MLGYGRENNDVERVKSATDIVRFVGEHVALKPRGREYVGLCPFHDDHKPSMCVIPSKGIFHCFVCGTGGDVLSFAQKFLRMEFGEAMRYLAERANIELTPLRRRGEQEQGSSESSASRSDLLAATAAACAFFKAILQHPEHGEAGREIIHRRGISPEMVEKFQIGAAPDRWDGLLLTLRKMGHGERPFAEAGLLKSREGGDGLYDAMRNRLIFPIHDPIGRVIAFGGRRIREEDEPKYINSPETRLFSKSATLYALNHASRAIQAERTAIITEGYTDAIACHQAGFSNTVATLGTALTRDHAAILRRLCDTVILLFDGDEAGQRAADRCVPIFFAEPIDVRIVTLNAFTECKDPDELLKKEGGADVFHEAIRGATDILEYRFARLRSRLRNAGIAALSKAIDEEIAQLVSWGLADVPPIRQSLIIKHLAGLSGLDEGTIRRAIPRGRGGSRPTTTSRDASEPAGSGEEESVLAAIRAPGRPLAIHMLGCVLCEGELWMTLADEQRDFISPSAYRSGLLSRVAHAVESIARRGDTPDLSAVLSYADDDLALKAVAIALHQRTSIETRHDGTVLRQHWAECLRRAELDRAASTGRENVAAGSSVPPASDALALIELKRKSHAALGADRRILPKPL